MAQGSKSRHSDSKREDSTMISKAHAYKSTFMMRKQEPQNKQPWINISEIHPAWTQASPLEQSSAYFLNSAWEYLPESPNPDMNLQLTEHCLIFFSVWISEEYMDLKVYAVDWIVYHSIISHYY